MTDKFRKAIAVDFDGVLHSYTTGWRGISCIHDAPVPGAIGWIIAITTLSPYDIIITSCRCNEVTGIRAMEDWIEVKCREYMESRAMYSNDPEGLEDDLTIIMASITFAVQKPERAFIFIDDRGFTFNGTFPSLQELATFIPWYRREDIR